ncbi:hypothetical protein ABBQ32_002553 [Trebouxia sp. C0010 RCD-2024]
MPASRDVDEEELSEEDEELQEDDEDEDRNDGRTSKKQSKKRKGSAFIDDAAEEDDEEDDDEEEDKGRHRKKRNIFVDDIAAVDEEEEEEEDDDEEEGWMEKDDLPSANEQMGMYRQQTRPRDDDVSLEAINDYVKERFMAPSQGYAEVGDEQATEVGQQGLQPTPQDPKLWLVECKTGSEREAVVSLMQKCVDLHAKRMPLAIKAVFTQDHLKGYLYVEAHKESHVTDAIKGLRIIRVSKGARLVPLKEMVSAIYVNTQAKSQLEENSWVRPRAGMYKSDLGQVVTVDYSKGVAEVRLVPRIDYTELAKRALEGRMPFGGHRAGAARPKPKAFSKAEAERRQQQVQEKRSSTSPTGYCFVMNNNTANRYEEGYLIREIPIKSLNIEEATPPVAELQAFNQVAQASREAADPGDEITALVSTMGTESTNVTTFKEGDRVLVTEGDLKNLDGVVASVNDEGKLMVKASLAELADSEPLPIEPQHVIKFFQAGDHVNVTSGAYSGRRGTVVKVKNKVCFVFDEVAQEEFEVFARDLSSTAAKVTASADRFGEYDLHDLVELDQQTAGVMIAADAETCQILTNRNAMTPEVPDVRTATLQDIKRKLYCARTISAPDSSGNSVNIGDMVDLVSQGNARLEGVSGTVKYIQRGALWLTVKDKLGADTSGFVCVDSRKTHLRGGRASGAPRAAAGILAGFKSPAPWATPARNAFTNPATMASPRPFDNGSSFGGMGAMSLGLGTFRGAAQSGSSGVQRTRREDNLIGTTIVVAKGPYRGYKGRVVSSTNSDVRMELEAQYKTVTVKREQLKGHESMAAPSGFGRPKANVAPWQMPSTRTPLHAGAATPLHGSATPLHPSATPMHPSATPMHPGAATPLRDAWSGGRTPTHPSMEGGTDEYDGYGSTSQRGATPSYAAGGYAGTPFNPGSDDSRHGHKNSGRVR